jgi:hypothetical protein
MNSFIQWRRRLTLRALICGVALVGAVALLTDRVASQDKDDVKPKAEQPAGEPAGEMAEMMAAWAKYTSPGEHHEHLKPLVGRWDLLVKWRMAPDAPMEEHKATSHIKWVIGGRFLLEEVHGDPEEAKQDPMMDQPFEGLGIIGYDNYAKKYVTMWIDSMGTMMKTEQGTCSQSGKVFEMTGEYNDPMTGQKKTGRSVMRIVNNDKIVGEMYEKGPDGKEFKMGEITYTRKK